MDEMIDIAEEKSGIIENIFTEKELDEVSQLMSKLPKHENNHASSEFFKPIGTEHLLYSWFDKKIFSKLKPLFNKDIYVNFGAYADEQKPLNIHSDYYHKKSELGEPCIAILLPLSVDNGNSSMSKSKTIIFNEKDADTDETVHGAERNYNGQWHRGEVKENNAEHLHGDLLGHCDKEDLKYLTVQNILEWKKGNVCWWAEEYLHVSNDFYKENVKSKQFFIIHTYTKEDK